MKNLVDVHCHLDDSRFENDLDAVIKRAKENNLSLIITAGTNKRTNRKILEIAKKDEIIKPSFGAYPVDAIAEKLDDLNDDSHRHIEKFSLDEELKWIEDNKDKCIAIGELGLDFKVLPESTFALQEEAFQKIIDLAKKINKPLIIHSRKAESKVIEMLEKNNFSRVNMHCFSAKKALIRKCVENGYFLSVPPVITRLNTSKH